MASWPALAALAVVRTQGKCVAAEHRRNTLQAGLARQMIIDDHAVEPCHLGNGQGLAHGCRLGAIATEGGPLDQAEDLFPVAFVIVHDQELQGRATHRDVP